MQILKTSRLACNVRDSGCDLSMKDWDSFVDRSKRHIGKAKEKAKKTICDQLQKGTRDQLQYSLV